MKRILLLLSTLILTATGAVSQSPQPQPGIGGPQQGMMLWKRYTVKGEDFSVILPAVPAMRTNKVSQTRLGKYRTERHLKSFLDGMVFSIQVFENPKPRQSLEEFIAEQNAEFEYDPASERGLSIDGFAGKEYSSRNKTSPTVVQFFATEERLFRFVASGPDAGGPAATLIFSSIKLGKKTDGIAVSDGPETDFLDIGDKIFKGKEVDAKARLLSKPEPNYTEDARSNRIEGTVVLRAIFSATGKVVNIRVVSGLPHGLTERAVDSAKKIKFIPAMKDGKPVSMWMQLEYNFDPYR